MTDIFGPIVPDTVIEDKLLETLKTWLPSYLGHVERATDRSEGAIADPKSWGIPQERFEKWPEKLTPHVAVISAGTTDDPVPDGEGIYMASFAIEVTCVVSGATPAGVESLAKAYIAAIESCLIQQPLGDPIEELEWNGHTPEDIGDKDRSMLAMTARFTVLASGVHQRRAGPRGEPQSDPHAPYPGYPTVSSPEVTVAHQPD